MRLELVPVVRYWEFNSKEIFAAIERIRDSGASGVAAFVPWSHLETDRHSLLQKFVRQCRASGLSLRLVVTPELGTGYSNGGVPDELLRERQNLAQDRVGQPFYACVPPNIHPLVSLVAPAVFQRYGHFLLKFTQVLSEVLEEGYESQEEQPSVELIVSDSLFKHYRNTGLNASDHGDFSLRHLQFGAGYKKEEWTPALGERIFHSRAFDFLQSRFSRFPNVRVESRHLFARDSSHGRLLEELVGAGPNHVDLFRELVRARAFCGIAWLDDLYRLRDRERNFLVSSAIVMFGEAWLNEHDYFSLSEGFRAKMRKLIGGFSTNETALSRPAIALSQNRFAPAQISTLLQDKLGVALKIKTSLSEIDAEERRSTKLFVVEEGFNLEFRQTTELLSFPRERDCTLVLFRSSLCENALKELKKLKTFRLNHGWLFEIGIFPGGGHVLLVEGQEGSHLSMNTLGDSLVSVARIDPFCFFDRGESGVTSVTVDWHLEGDGSSDEMKTLFLMNPDSESRKLTLEFTHPAQIHGSGAGAESGEGGAGKCFETELPALSVIPLSVVVERPRILMEETVADGAPAELA
jgi:hypothetical protein